MTLIFGEEPPEEWLGHRPGVTPDTAQQWHMHADFLAAWVERIREADPLDERQNLAFQHAFDSTWRLLRKFDALQLLRENQPTSGELEEEAKHVLFEATETFFLQTYTAISAINALVVRYPTIFGRDVPTSSVQKFIVWLGSRFEVGLPIDFMELARRFRAVLTHAEQQPAYNWGYSPEAPRFIFLHGRPSRSGALPPGSRMSEVPQLVDQWVFPAPDEQWVVDSIGLVLMFVVVQIIEPFIGGQPPEIAVMSAPFGPSLMIDPETSVMYIPIGTKAR